MEFRLALAIIILIQYPLSLKVAGELIEAFTLSYHRLFVSYCLSCIFLDLPWIIQMVCMRSTLCQLGMIHWNWSQWPHHHIVEGVKAHFDIQDVVVIHH